MEDNQMNDFLKNWNTYRESLNMNALVMNRGYKFTRFVNPETEVTEAFVDNETGDIYKAASNVARAKTIRGTVFDSDLFSTLLANGRVAHFQRGRKSKKIQEEVCVGV